MNPFNNTLRMINKSSSLKNLNFKSCFAVNILDDATEKKPNFDNEKILLINFFFYFLLYNHANLGILILFLIMHEFLSTIKYTLKNEVIYTMITIKMISTAVSLYVAPYFLMADFLYSTSAIFGLVALAFREGREGQRGIIYPLNNLAEKVGLPSLSYKQLTLWREVVAKLSSPAFKKAGLTASATGGGLSFTFLFLDNERKSIAAQTARIEFEVRVLEAGTNHAIKLRDENFIDFNTAQIEVLKNFEAMAILRHEMKNIKTPGTRLHDLATEIIEKIL
jgi:hypothetical protein